MEHFSFTNCDGVTLAFATYVAKIDAKRVSSSDAFVKKNSYQYRILMSTWLFQVNDVSERACIVLGDAISKLGLIEVITQCQHLADSLISGTLTDCPNYLHGLITEDKQQTLQLLRYPKRLTLVEADLLNKRALDSFVDLNRSRYCCGITTDDCDVSTKYPWQSWSTVRNVKKTFGLGEVSFRLREDLSRIIYDMIGDAPTIHYEEEGYFSSGVANDARKPLYGKILSFADWCPHIGGIPLTTGDNTTVWNAPKVVTVQPVPKNYKTPRLIAPEDAYRSYQAQAVRAALEDALKESGYWPFCNYRQQETNQCLAFAGSIDGSWSTIDSSSASDSIARSLIFDVFPQTWVNVMRPLLADYFKVDPKGNPMKMRMFSTSGHPLTFIVEDIFFLAVALLSSAYCSIYTGEDYKHPFTMGDDLVVDTNTFDTVVDVLAMFGITVNTEKSFNSGLYRESCGVEYECGLDMSTRYWPRQALINGTSALPILISLEKRLYSNWYARRFLIQMVRDIEPRMTSHLPGVECSDLWEDLPLCKYANPPYYGKVPFDPSCVPLGDVTWDLRREYHLAPVTVYDDQDLSVVGRNGLSKLQTVENYRYIKFLIEGVSFDSPLDELLNVHSKQTDILSSFSSGKIEWKYTRE